MEFYRNLGDAPVILLVALPCFDEERQSERASSLVSATTEMMLIWLLAHEKGLGACGITIPPFIGTQIARELGLGNRELVYGLSIGYPDEYPPRIPHPRVPVTYED